MASTAPIRILNVDDYSPQRYAKSRVLRQAGFEVIEAEDGDEALRVLSGVGPQVVLLDVNLPGTNGIEVCHRIKSDPQTASILVVQVSATFTSERQQDFVMAGGADLFLVEPIEPEELISAVRALLRLRGAEADLRESETRFRLLADTAPVMIWMAGTDKMADHFNKPWLTFTGRTLEQEFGIGWTEGLHPDDRERVVKTVSTAFDARQQFEVEYRLRRYDGEYRWMFDRGVPRFSPTGEFSGYIGSCIDISDRKRMDQERDQLLASEHAARQSAEAANRLKDEFLATVSHELRTPLNAMLGWANLLGSGKLSPEGNAKAIDVIMRNAKAQAQLIDDILDASRIVTGKMMVDVQAVELPAVIGAALDTIRPAAEAKGVALRARIDPNVRPVPGDAARLQQVVWNLLSNAVKFTPAGGSVEIKLAAVDGAMEIEVSDTGEGIKAEFVPFIFDRFRQADASTTRIHGGLGLGLAIVRHIVELHGGTATAESAGEGRGAAFKVRLPVSSSHRFLPSPAQQASSGASEQPVGVTQQQWPETLAGARVLVVDDEPTTLDLVATLFRQCGAEVMSADSAASALMQIEQGNPSLIVSDIGMPGQDGYAFMREVRAREKSQGGWTPAIALTAYARVEDRVLAISAGYQAHVAKPIAPMELMTIAAGVLQSGRR